MKVFFGLFLLWGICPFMMAQDNEMSIKVYDFDDGLSHRNVFSIQQDSVGYIWVGTINGLNRFDGYRFEYYEQALPQIQQKAVVSLVANSAGLVFGMSNFIGQINLNGKNAPNIYALNGKSDLKRQAQVPHDFFVDSEETLWGSVYDERTAKTTIFRKRQQDSITYLFEAKGNYPGRPLIEYRNHIFVAMGQNEIWKLKKSGQIVAKFKAPLIPTKRRSVSNHVVQLFLSNDQLWVLLSNGYIFSFDDVGEGFKPHPLNELLQKSIIANALLVEENHDIWIGGNGILLQYKAKEKQLINHTPKIKSVTKNTCQFREIFKDKTGAIWLATDYGAIKLVFGSNLFQSYLNGGSEYCTDRYCSTREITEDDKGNIYISYYNSIHILNPKNDNLIPLFSSGDFFNYPFGLHYFRGALWAGNGIKINLNDLSIDTIFPHPKIDLGYVMEDKNHQLWMGCMDKLFLYDPDAQKLVDYQDRFGKWDEQYGQISYIYQGKTKDYIWVSTLDNGLFQLTETGERINHYSKDDILKHNKINHTLEDDFGHLWIASGMGLYRLNIDTDTIRYFTTKDGLPNDFINGILPEGDSCLWISTDYGLSRMSMQTEKFINFFVTDGLSANEFNRNSFYKSKDGRMYFGGMNGVNAFYPEKRLLAAKEKKRKAPLLLTRFTKLNSREDSLYVQQYGLSELKQITLSPDDEFFSLDFSLADYRYPSENLYSYRLEGYENEWSAPLTNHSIRYTNIPPGKYTFKVKSKAHNEDWSENILSIDVTVQKPYYQKWWFLLLMALLAIGAIWALLRFRIYRLKKNERMLEKEVQTRTLELRQEKQKSDELLLNILPREIADELKQKGYTKARRHDFVAVLFSDFVGFSKIAAKLEPEDLVDEIDYCFSAFDEIIEKYQIEKIKTVGDAYLAVGGMTAPGKQKVIDIINAGLEMQAFMKKTEQERKAENRPYFRMRVGVHIGPLVAGIVGIKKFAYDVWGDTVNIASRMETNGMPNFVNISQATYDLIKEDFHCIKNGTFEGMETDINMYMVESYLTPSPSEMPD